MKLLHALLPVAVLLFAAACGNDATPESKAQDLLKQMEDNEKLRSAQQSTQQAGEAEGVVTPSVSVSDIRGTNDQKAGAIARIVTQEADGLALVPLGETPLHGYLLGGEEEYGSHYRVFVTKSVHDMTGEEFSHLDFLINEIFRLSTLHIINEDESVTHMGVLTVYADLWPAPFAPGSSFAGYDPEDPSNLCVADGKDLARIYENASSGAYSEVAQCQKINAIRSSEVQEIHDLIDQIAKSR